MRRRMAHFSANSKDSFGWHFVLFDRVSDVSVGFYVIIGLFRLYSVARFVFHLVSHVSGRFLMPGSSANHVTIP